MRFYGMIENDSVWLYTVRDYLKSLNLWNRTCLLSTKQHRSILKAVRWSLLLSHMKLIN